jgi:hypothetical protein
MQGDNMNARERERERICKILVSASEVKRLQ